MKLIHTTLFLVVLFGLAACGGASNSQSDKGSDTPADQPVTATALEPLKDPCVLLSSADIVSIDGFEKSTDGGLHMGSGDTYKQCDYSIDNGDKNVHLTVVFKRSNERQIEASRLEKDYEFYLKQDGYAAVSGAPGDDAIFNHRTSDVPSGKDHLYMLQVRYGNHTEYQIALAYGNDEQNADEVTRRLLAIAQKLDE